MENILSVSELLFPNQYRRKVLALMLMNPHKWVHLRELARMTGASPGTLKKELDALSGAGAIHDAQSTPAREINPKVMSREEWNNKKNAGNSFVQELIRQPQIFIKGSASEL